MYAETILIALAAGALAFAGLRLRRGSRYRRLQAAQAALLGRHGPALGLPEALPDDLPGLDGGPAVVSHPVPDATLDLLRDAALRYRRTERSFVPTHKQGGTIAYEHLHEAAPEIVAFYQSDYLRRLCGAVVGLPLVPTPLHDQSSCSLLVYDRPRDHIGWHYDHNFYRGRHFTVLLGLLNGHLHEERLSSAELWVRQDGLEFCVPTPPNTLILFEGARVLHKVTRLGEDERRVMLSMTFCTDPRASALQGALRRVKDTAFYGVRALWT
jgi:hypothetical protein